MMLDKEEPWDHQKEGSGGGGGGKEIFNWRVKLKLWRNPSYEENEVKLAKHKLAEL